MALPEVLLIGDSIRMGYQEAVRRELQDVATVWGPEANGGHSVNVLMHMHLWVLNRKPQPAVIHLNTGLHDIKTIYYGSRTQLVPMAHYRENLKTLLGTLQQRTACKLVFAATTPVIDDVANSQHAQWQDFCRFNNDVVAYNEVAVAVCQEFGVPVNDLYAVVQQHGVAQLQSGDGVHYSPTGCEVLGKAVAQAVRSML